jgi:hypothetical protein
MFIIYFEVMFSTVKKPDFTFYLASMISVEFGIHEYDSQHSVQKSCIDV